jgi:hypothetical protein
MGDLQSGRHDAKKVATARMLSVVQLFIIATRRAATADGTNSLE